jgi:hypothetical protein
VIQLGLRLVLSGGREALTRLAVVAVAVGLGVGLLLIAVAATNAVSTANSRYAWFWTGTASVPAGPAAAGIAPLWWQPSGDLFDGRRISRFDAAATGASSPVPPGIPHDPGPGQYYASPALAALLRSTPADQLADRYPGHLAGLIGDAALPSPDSLVIIVGRTPAQLADTPNSVPVTSIATRVPADTVPSGNALVNPKGLEYYPPGAGIGASTSDLILSVVAVAVLVPVLIFIGTATRLSAARREQRFAAMRLVGATRKQVSLLAAVESTTAAVAGVALGFGVFFLLRIPVAGTRLAGQPVFPSELSLSPPDVLAVAVGVPAAAAAGARLALRRVHISPLGVARRVTPQPPRAWRMLPLLAGLAELGFFAVHGQPASIPGQIQEFVSGFLLIIVGLIIAGPWLTMAAARIMARWTSGPGALIAARRLADDPRAAFRAVSGLVLALFLTTVAAAFITTQDAKDLTQLGSPAEASVVTDQLADQQQPSDTSPGNVVTMGVGPAAPAAPLTAQLSGIPGVHGVIVVRADSQPNISMPLSDGTQFYEVPAGVVSCAQLAAVPALGRCPAGASAAAFPEYGFDGLPSGTGPADITWPAANVPAARLDTLGVDAINVATNGSTAAVEQVWTVLENAHAYPNINGPSTIADVLGQGNSPSSVNGLQQLADTVILVSLLIAGCTLAAGIAGGLADRKRPFSLLRLTGARLGTLRRVVALEGAIPLLAVAVVAIGAGFGAAAMFTSAAQQHPMVAPGAAYYLITAGGILAALGIIAATFPLLARITGPEVARNE